ncbi:glycerol 3-phosphate dehydrogenase (NAD(P)+) [Clostridium amylolyticum]|uniref:Glycerol-3-phosphate dehydrogenase [NAD(P)+] n=1 Tax=Clostridium amylolyticum TaxID=1121298 RepID=A0A1M6D3S7_9CLOT|nr:NAD(P)H-dependent glycerol-3-phosphate dehydrogenase [Clostridium amylolyticum]SHI67910.1 glycerol 3-phosphate dehydrogenase (NAD(P)+) [Clostridium amylolyticum]
MTKVAFLGAGSFGTALSLLLVSKGLEVSIWDRDEEVINNINNYRRNYKYTKDIYISELITAYNNIKETVQGCNYIVLAVPSHAIRSLCSKIKDIIPKDAIIISIAKGIEDKTNKRLSQVISEELLNPVVILSGPSHAEEVLLNIPTTVVVTSTDMTYAEKVQDLFMSPNFRVYTNDDIIGIEIGGSVKNIIALAAGVCDGIGYGDNAKAALMTRGMVEIIRIGEKLGGRAETFSGLTGMGDLIVTCTSMHSRNRRAGILIGKGIKLEDAVKEIGMVVEGVKACKSFYELKEELNIEMPITHVLYEVLFQGKDPKAAVEELMSREKKSEVY